jgi:uncharacterized protein
VSDPRGASAAPGWYPDPTGTSRWWDGHQWGPAVHEVRPAPPQPVAPNKTLAILAHLGPILGGFILPLVIYLAADRRDLYVRHHASEGLNFALTLLAASLSGMVLVVLSLLVAAAAGSAVFGLAGFFVVWLVLVAVGIAGIVFAIIGAIQASHGNWWRYPIVYRFVDGVAPVDTPPLMGF